MENRQLGFPWACLALAVGGTRLCDFDAQSMHHGARPGPTLAPWCTHKPPACPAAEGTRKDPRLDEKRKSVSEKKVNFVLYVSTTYLWTDLPSRREGVHTASFSSSVLRQPSGRLVQRADGVAPSAIPVYGHLLNLQGIRDPIYQVHALIQHTVLLRSIILLAQIINDAMDSSTQRVAKRVLG